MPYTCLIADDEDLALAIVEKYLELHNDVEIVARCFNGREVKDQLEQHKPQLLLLDIQMPLATGLEIASHLNDNTAVIFTTAYPQYALESYNLNALDYLLKPFSQERFDQALKKAKDYIDYRAKNAVNTGTDDHIYVKADYQLHKLLFDEILFLESKKQYVKIVTNNASYMVLESLKNFEDRLTAQNFIRVHRSFIVAKNKITSMGAGVLNIGSHEIPVGNLFKSNIDWGR
jgi:two-component system, LytTR family, response regulator